MSEAELKTQIGLVLSKARYTNSAFSKITDQILSLLSQEGWGPGMSEQEMEKIIARNIHMLPVSKLAKDIAQALAGKVAKPAEKEWCTCDKPIIVQGFRDGSHTFYASRLFCDRCKKPSDQPKKIEPLVMKDPTLQESMSVFNKFTVDSMAKLICRVEDIAKKTDEIIARLNREG